MTLEYDDLIHNLAVDMLEWGLMVAEDHSDTAFEESFPDLEGYDLQEAIHEALSEAGSMIPSTRSGEKADASITSDKERIIDLEAQLSIAFEIMTDKQIKENQHLFQQRVDIENSDSIDNGDE